jgi:radical SAM protein with 4Fe4S-binding SPASM domain
MIAEHIIDNNKRTSTGEIIVTLFEFCDINCLFCNQDHNSMVGIDIIPDKINHIKLAINELKKKGKTEFAINIMGGEVFSDKLPDSIFGEYEKLIALIDQLEYPIKLSFVTNFIWKKQERVKEFITKNNIKLFTSYDPSGRFNPETFEIFKTNVIEFTPNIRCANIIMTKPNIDKFLKNQVPFFDYMYNNFELYFDYYTPEKHMDVLLPKDVDLRDFMIHMDNHWPNCYPFKDLHLKKKKDMTCMDTYTIMPNGSFGSCSILLKDVIPIKLIPSKKDLETEWFEDYKCLECEHFNRCSLGCFLSNHIKDARTQKECWLKQVYDHVDSKWT